MTNIPITFHGNELPASRRPMELFSLHGETVRIAQGSIVASAEGDPSRPSHGGHTRIVAGRVRPGEHQLNPVNRK